MNRRGFLKLLGGAAAAVLFPLSRICYAGRDRQFPGFAADACYVDEHQEGCRIYHLKPAPPRYLFRIESRPDPEVDRYIAMFRQQYGVRR